MPPAPARPARPEPSRARAATAGARGPLGVDPLPLGRGGVRIRAELLPSTAWGSDVQALVQGTNRRAWERLRARVCDAAGNRCEACGASSATAAGRVRRPECHEVWDVDVAAGVQRLRRIAALCPACHEVQHLARAQERGRVPEAVAHLAAVNGWTHAEAVADVRRAQDRFVALVGASYDLDLDLTVLDGRATWPDRDRLYWTAAERRLLAEHAA